MNPGICKWIPPIFVFSFPNIIRTPDLPRDTPKGFSGLLKGNETGRVGGTNTGTTVLDRAAFFLLVITSISNVAQKEENVL